MTAKNPSQALKEVAEGTTLPPSIVVTAPNPIRRDRSLAYLLQKYTQRGLIAKTASVGDSGRDSITAFLNELREPSLFEPHRLGVIRHIEKAKATDLEPLVKFLEANLSGVTLIVVGTGLPNNAQFKKASTAHSVVVAFEPLKGAELRRWAERELRQAGIPQASDDLVEGIIALAGESPEAAAQLIEKYALFLDGAPASLESLKVMFPERSQASDFELAESIAFARREQTEVLIHTLVEQGSSPFMLMGLLGKTWTNVLRLRALADRGIAPNDIRTRLGLSPWLLNKQGPLAKRISTEHLWHNVGSLLKTDFRLKDRSLGPQALIGALARDLHPKEVRPKRQG